MLVRDRIQGFCRVPASRLEPHPRNWRTHPARQRLAMSAVLQEIGYAGALIARELPDGRLQLIDGHLRAETTPDQEVPVLLVELSDDEALKLLAIFDPLSGLAEANVTALRAIAAELKRAAPILQETLREAALAKRPSEFRPRTNDDKLAQSFQVVVECDDEAQQRHVYERLTGEGLRCRLLNF
jgi:ParB-like chromosome segregation protein Spo0J